VVLNTHLLADYRDSLRTRFPFQAIQERQLDQLSARIRAEDPEVPLVVVGDLNVPAESGPLCRLREACHLEDAMAGEAAPSMVGPGEFVAGPWVPRRAERLDAVLFRASGGGLRLLRAGYVLDRPSSDPTVRGTLSDHRGVLAEFQMQK